MARYGRRYQDERGDRMVAPSVLRGGERPASGREAGQRAAHVALAQPLERAVAQLTDTLTRDAEHAADLLERVLAAAVEPEIEPQHLGIARRQGAQRRLDFLGQEGVPVSYTHLRAHE